MSKEREMIEKLCSFQMTYSDWLLLRADAEELLAQPESTAMAVMPNGVCVSNVYDAYEEGRKSVMVEQEPVAWYWEDSDLDDPEWIAMADTGDKPIEHRLRRNIQPLYLAPQKSAEAELEQALKDTIDTTKLMQILKDGGILIEEEQINELAQEQEPSSHDYYKNIELRKEVQTKSQTKQEPKVCPNKMRNGNCPLPDPLCGYPNCEK